jgi:RimJ/RimL family protein N-acetyltransferase
VSEPPASETVRLDDGLELLVRPIRGEDRELLAEAFEQLSPESRYRRFFSPLERLSEQDLAYLTGVDHQDHEALVAIDPASDGIIGVARYVRSEDPTGAEVAVVVGDPWQKRGVASTLLDRLVGRARAAGINHFIALVMSDNEDALELFRHLASGNSYTRRSASGNTEMLIELPEPGGELSDSRLGRILSTVARDTLSVNPWRVLRQAIRRRPTEEMRIPESTGDQ